MMHFGANHFAARHFAARHLHGVREAEASGGVSLGNFNYRRDVEQVKKSPAKVVRKAAEEVLEYLDTGEIALAAIAAQSLAVAREFVQDVLTAPAIDAEALLARAEQTKILAALQALEQLLADDEEAITVLLLN
jgi:hypothetical protein